MLPSPAPPDAWAAFVHVGSRIPSVDNGLLGFGLALVIALLTTPVARAFAWRIGAIDEPRERSLHQFPTPRLDGLAAGVCTITAITFALIAFSQHRIEPHAAGVLALITAGASLGYLRHGFHPASIFLGDSGSNLLGYLLGAIVVQGTLKTNALVGLAFPLVILAVPILDSSFVIAKRIKYRRPVYQADRSHFHHRFANIGFSQRKTALYIYGWTLVLAALALALRFIPYSDHHGHFNLRWTLVLAGFGVLAFVASVYLVLVLEILKLKRFRQFQLRRERTLEGQPGPADAEVDASVARELETGEFETVDVRRRG